MQAIDESDYLAHYGILRKSGRYPWGSGKTPLQRSKTFLDFLDEQKKSGLSEAQIAKMFDERPKYPFTVADLRALRSRAVTMRTEDRIRTAQALKDKGMSTSSIGRQMQLNESTVRSLLEPGRLDRLDVLQKTSDMLRRQVDSLGSNEVLDIGAHVERDLPIDDNPETRVGISKDKFNTAVSMLKEEGYPVHTFSAPQVGTGERTNYKVLCKPGTTRTEAFANRANLRLIAEKSDDGGHNYRDLAFKKPLSIDPKRIGVRYKEDGGADADGVIYVRPGVKDISMGKSHYAQVRIAVGGTHYLKGMAIYKDDLPSGVDLLFNTNKSNTGNKLDALKPLKKAQDGSVDWTNPFGSFPKLEGGQIVGEHGKVTSAMNLLSEQGDWNNWSRNLSRQVLSKQSPDLAKSQLDVTYERKINEFSELKSLTNALIKRTLLETFADETDSSSVHLKAANMAKQATKVLMPTPSMKPDEVFAPTFRDGERVALVRFPHAGTFEIPQLTVNNRNREAKKLFTDAKGELQAPDVIGIHPKVAERLSGADFDGDTVVVIPNSRGQIESRDALAGLKGFDPQKYKVPSPEEDPVNGRVTVAKDSIKQNEMGKVTNLIADMTLRGANDEELARAVRHSMVVIDSEKHNLDYKASERDNGILDLKRKYQGGPRKGASTLITKTTAREDVQKRKAALSRPGVTRLTKSTVDNKTGEKVYDLIEDINPNTGKPRTFRSKKGAETKDARTLLSEHGGTKTEQIYAEHSNKLRALANEARLEAISAQPEKKSASAAEVYAPEVAALKSRLNNALKNAPRERQAQVVANFIMAQRRNANPDMEASEKKKIRAQALEAARFRTGAHKDRIEISDREWQAIQAHALSIDTLKNILRNTDVDKLKERATPRNRDAMTPVMVTRARTMKSSGITDAEIADALGVSVSTLHRSLTDGG